MAACRADSSTCSVRSLDRGSLSSVHEQTPLLGWNPASANISKSEVPPLRKGSAVDDPHLLEAQSGNAVSDSPEDGPRSRTAASVASVIPVLLLGASA